MGIWVRKQNKKALALIVDFRMGGVNKFGKYIIKGSCNGTVSSEYTLGEYETEEKTLEVLDKIQHHIAMLEHNKMYVKSPEEQYNYEDYVFEMPEK